MLGGGAVRNFDEVEQALRASGYLDSRARGAWPPVAPDKLVRSLSHRRPRSRRPRTGSSTRDEQRLLRRRGPGWSDGDVPLLDEAHALVGVAAARRTAT